jgi:hypothetical protein
MPAQPPEVVFSERENPDLRKCFAGWRLRMGLASLSSVFCLCTLLPRIFAEVTEFRGQALEPVDWDGRSDSQRRGLD